MKSIKMAFFLVATVNSLLAATSWAGLMGYAATDSENSVVYRWIDSDVNNLIPLGPSGIYKISALDISPIDGKLYAVNRDRDLYQIDTTSGIGILIKKNIAYGYRYHSLSFSPDGTFYGIFNDNANLYKINTLTGNVTIVGSLSPYVSAKAFATDNNEKGIAWDSGAYWLFEINLADGSTKSIGPFFTPPGYGGNTLNAFDYDTNGTLYGWNGVALYIIDTLNIQAIEVRYFGFGLQGGFTIIPENPTLTLLFPNGAEQLFSGTITKIQWETTGHIENVKMEYSTDNGSNWSEVNPPNTGNMGYYNWTVPSVISEQCLVRVSDVNDSNIFDISDGVFVILPEPTTLSLFLPNGGERLISGTISPIGWEFTGQIENVKIEYSIDNGSSWSEVDPPNTGNMGYYNWTVPSVISEQCLVRVSDVNDSNIFDISDGVFAIDAINLKYPNGGQKLLINSPCTIEWDFSPLISEHLIKIESSADDGQNWTEVAITDNNGLYEWKTPKKESNQYLIRLTDINDTNNTDVSDETFVIYSCKELIQGDVNGDCFVDFRDVALLASNWLVRAYINVHEDTLDSDPNWTTQGEWAFGQPLGNGGSLYGNPDPNSGSTGSNVYGVNLNGDYSTSVGGPYYLTAGPFDCRHYENMKLKFARWLNTDSDEYAPCTVEVSNDGVNWELIWMNIGIVTDNSWQAVEYYIGDVADHNKTVYIRWGYEVFNGAHPYSGWNIDDVELSGNPDF